MELILNCTNYFYINDIINKDISYKKFITYNNYHHTHFFVAGHNLKKTTKNIHLKKYLTKMKINLKQNLLNKIF